MTKIKIIKAFFKTSLIFHNYNVKFYEKLFEASMIKNAR